jgi:nucleotide-binding universal stress UspA family protein
MAARLAGEDKSWIKVLAVVPAYEGDMELIGVSNIKETIAGPGQKLLDEAKGLAAAADVHILADMAQGEPYDKIVHVAEEEKCDLIIMGRSGHSHLERALMGSVTARVIGHTDRNVLVMPDQAELAWDRILLATDGSENSRAAADLALEIAREKGAALTAVSVVYTNDEFIALAPEMVTELVGKAEKVLDALKERGAEQGVTVETAVKEGEPHEAITRLAADINASLIVMGTFGRKGLHRLLMGSVTERTIGYAACPVLVAH